MQQTATQRRVIVAPTMPYLRGLDDATLRTSKLVVLPETASYYTIAHALDQDRRDRYAIHMRPLATDMRRDGRRVSRWFKALAPCIAYLRWLYARAAVDHGPAKVYTQEPHWAAGPFVDARDHPLWHLSRATPGQRFLDDTARADLKSDLEQVHIPDTIRVGGRDFAPQQAPQPRIDGGAGFGLPGLPTQQMNFAPPQPTELTDRDRTMRAHTKRLIGQWWASDLSDDDRATHEWCARFWWPELFTERRTPEEARTLFTSLLRLGVDNVRASYEFLDEAGNIIALDGPELEQVRDGG